MNEFLKGIVFYFINHILNKIPSRYFRMFFYSLLSKGNISRKASIGLGVRILDIRNVKIGDYTNINFNSILDGRGDGIEIGTNVDISPQVNVWSLEHNPNAPNHASRSGKVIIGDNCWIANRVTILPATHILKNSVLAANSLVKGVYKENSILMGGKAEVRGERAVNIGATLTSIRKFR
ncbi:acyltransferase [Colwellia sp. BRX8-2]|uniref:acyltransferase n=1 Tax=unclassified Colwellia TaxID=196834 RepID=UPI0015F7346F|nr:MULTISPECIES: acyltransferase [unclassified Colwellia]MBA6362074.1 acyltransferase [Colwellia sp. BRX8-6]MBA6369682.1 acyltransferase [Colwellia sp. BRX8-5]MBA6377416.1 acyltransferase [Colwellia sp. BRX8-2]